MSQYGGTPFGQDPYGQNPYGAPQSPYGMPPQQPSSQGGGKATASLVLGLIGLLAWCCPLVGLGVGIGGVVLGAMSLDSDKRGMAIAGLVLSGICLLLSTGNAVWGIVLAVQGQNPLVPMPQ